MSAYHIHVEVVGSTVEVSDPNPLQGNNTPSVVTSVFGRVGAVIAQLYDYLASQVENDSSVSGGSVKDALEVLDAGKQPLDPALTSIAGLTTSSDEMLYTTGVDTYALSVLTAFIRTLLDDPDAATARTTLGAASASGLAAHLADLNDPHQITWAQVDKTISDIADIVSRSHTDLQDLGFNASDHTIDGDLDMNDNQITDAKGIDFGAPTELTVDGGSITPTKAVHTISSEGGASIDYVDTIATSSYAGLLFVRQHDAGETIVLRHGTGNLELNGADIVLDSLDKFAVLLYDEALSKYVVLIGADKCETVWNSTGGPVTIGTVIAPTGSITSGRRNIWEAEADASGASVKRRGAFALAGATIGDGSSGPAVCHGPLAGVNTSTFSAGDELYMSETQGLPTNVKPLLESSQIRVGWVITSDATNGIIWVEFKDLSWVGLTQAGTAAFERTGFSLIGGQPVDTAGTAISLSIDDGSLELTISSVAGTFGVYSVNNLFFKVGDQSVNWTDVEGDHYFYFTSTGVLTHTTTFSDSFILGPEMFVAYLYWDATNKATILSGPLTEMHGLQMDGASHLHFHTILGAQVKGSGLALNTVDVAGTGASDSHAQFGVDSGEITDEDLMFAISSVGSTTGLPILYLDGVAGDLRETAKVGFSVIDDVAAGVGATGRLVWNEWTGATWQLSTVSVNDFVLCHVFAIGTGGGGDQLYAVVGQDEYGTANQARDGAEVELGNLVTQLPFAEVRPIASVIFQTGPYGNAVLARVRPSDDGDYVDWRKDSVPGGVGFTPSIHNSLAGRSDVGCHPAEAISVDASGFSGALSGTDTDAQTALETLDAGAKLAYCRLETGDIGLGAGALTPLDAFNVSSASKANPFTSLDKVTINFTSSITTPYQVIIEWIDTIATSNSILAPVIQSKTASSVVFSILEGDAGTQDGEVNVLIIDRSKV